MNLQSTLSYFTTKSTKFKHHWPNFSQNPTQLEKSSFLLQFGDCFIVFFWIFLYNFLFWMKCLREDINFAVRRSPVFSGKTLKLNTFITHAVIWGNQEQKGNKMYPEKETKVILNHAWTWSAMNTNHDLHNRVKKNIADPNERGKYL